jgi:hypothetical protein
MTLQNKFYGLLMPILFILMSPASYAKPVLNDWFALGSGCRARSDLAGNVTMEEAPAFGGGSQRYKANFLFKGFSLDGAKADHASARFGRECAIRLNINPPIGKKIHAIRAYTKLLVEKPSGLVLNLLSELKLGPTSLGREQYNISPEEKWQSRELTIELAGTSDSKESFPQLGCSEPKIIGFDYSWIATGLKGRKNPFSVELAGNGSLVIEADLVDCAGD